MQVKPQVQNITDAELAQSAYKTFEALRHQLQRRVIGQHDVVEQLLVTLVAGGHALFVGVPGLAKTLLVRTLAQASSLDHRRIQFTPDLMPADITGTQVLDVAPDGSKSFRFVRGPMFANLILADEINRTPAKTQAALLESMQEGHISSGESTYRLPRPFHVFATQNPVEQEGTFVLPEAQLDRFMMAVHVDYPAFDDEVAILRQSLEPRHVRHGAILDSAALMAFQGLSRRVPVAEALLVLATQLVRRTRPHEQDAPTSVRRWVTLGAGPRATLHLVRAAQARALVHGRFAVDRSDLFALALPVLRHRWVLDFASQTDDAQAPAMMEDVIKSLA